MDSAPPKAIYCDIEIHIRKPAADGAHPVEMHVSSGDMRAEGLFRSPYADADIDRVLDFIETEPVDAAYVQDFGTQLFHALFDGPLKSVYSAARLSGDAPLRFRMIADTPAVARIPWELLYDPERAAFLALEGPLVRGGSFVAATRPILVKPPLRILIIDAFPRGVPPLRSQVEAAAIKLELAGLVRRGRVEVETLAHATLAGLQNALREAAHPANPRPFHLLHIICHGQRDTATGQTTLLLEDESGDIDAVDDTALTNVLKPYDIKLVLLNACRAVQASAHDIARGIAPALLAAGVPAVIGMQVSVQDTVARQFAKNFYSALADNQPVDSALTEARRLARGTRRYQKANLAIPVCYLRTPNGQILELEQPDRMRLTRATWRPWLRAQLTPWRLLGGLLSVITLLSTLVGLYTGVLSIVAPAPTPIVFPTSPPPSPTPIAPMNGQINVVVAEFGALDDQGKVVSSTVASGLSDSTYRQLDEELKAFSDASKASGQRIDILVRGPAQVGRIIDATHEERARTAEQLARAHNADVVVYGNIRLGDDSTNFQPEFFISTERLREAAELNGPYDLGTNVAIPYNIVNQPFAQGPLRDALVARTEALTQFVIGLGYYSLDDLEHAAKRFTAAEQAPGWNDREGKEVLYLFLGNTAIVSRNLELAQQYYMHGYELNHEYARTRFGLAEVTFQKAQTDGCQSGKADLDGLRRAIEGYNSVLTAKLKPPLADVDTKAAFGLGRVYVCLSHADPNHVADYEARARTELDRIIADYARGNQRVKELAAEAHGFLGQIALANTDDARAEQEYRAAIDLSRYPERQAIFSLWLAYIHQGQKDCTKIDEDLTRADQLYVNKRRPAPEFESFRERMRQERANMLC